MRIQKSYTGYDQAVKENKLDFSVSLEPSGYNHPVRGFIGGKGLFNTVRQDTGEVLGQMKSRYKVIQNTEAFKVFTESRYMEITFAHNYDNGRTMLMQAKIEDVVLDNGDVIENYLTFLNSHDGTGTCRIFTTAERIVCDNFLKAAKHNRFDNAINIRHTASSEAKLADAANYLNLAVRNLEVQKKDLNELISTPFNADKADKFFVDLICSERSEILSYELKGIKGLGGVKQRKLEVLMETFKNAIGQYDLNNAFAAMNAVTYVETHLKENSKLDLVSVGTTSIINRAYELLLN